MTEKRFQWVYIKDNTLELRDNGIVKVFNNERFEELLNDLSEENEQLRKENDMLSCELSVSANKEISRNCRIAELEEENKQLKQFKEKVFTLIDKEIARNEKAIEWGKETGVDSGSIEFYNHMLYRLKKELEE